MVMATVQQKKPVYKPLKKYRYLLYSIINMDKDSQQIQKFIKKSAKKYREPNARFSQESRIFIQRIFHYIEKGSLSYKTNSSKISVKNIGQLPTGKHYQLLESDVKENIEQRMRVFKIVEFEIEENGGKKRTFRIFMSFLKPTEETITEWIKRIYIWLYVANHFAMPSCSNALDIYIYYTDMKKTLPETDGYILDHENANTAFTFACNMPGSHDKNEIYIYRLEEWFKVLVHESFHSFGLDFASMDQTAVQHRICSSGDIYQVPCGDLRFYESYTEMWAELIQCIFVCENNMDTLEMLVYEYEAPFSAFQCAKVLDHFGLVYEDLFDKEAASGYKEETPVFAYYVIKSVFMNHADEFIRWTMQNNQGSLQFKKTQTNINHLASLLKSLAHPYIEKMQMMDRVLDGPMNILLASTMRMTCISAI